MTPIAPHVENAVYKIALRIEEHYGSPNDPELFIPDEVPILDQDDPRVHLSRAGEPHEVVDVFRHEDAVLGVRAVQDDVVSSLEEPALPHVNGVQSVLLSEDLCHLGRDVLIEQQLDVHAGAPCAGRPS